MLPDPKKTYIISEIGVNHNGSIALAKKLVDEASNAGVDAVKFQTYKTENVLSSKDVKKTPYQTRDSSTSQYDMLKKLELSSKEFAEIKKHTEKKGVEFMSTACDLDSVDILENIGVNIYKIASAEIINKPLVAKVAKTGKPILLSTGMATMDEIERTINYIKDINNKIVLYLLHCTTSYPTVYSEVNMNLLKTLQERFSLPIGYSDHTIGIEVSLMAVAQGAKIIEKHFTLDRAMDGPDHFASIEPDELKTLVKSIRNIEQSFGKSQKMITKEEKINIEYMRRSIHLARDVKKGQEIRLNDISFTRPYDGIEIWEYDDFIGRKINKNKSKGKPLLYEDF